MQFQSMPSQRSSASVSCSSALRSRIRGTGFASLLAALIFAAASASAQVAADPTTPASPDPAKMDQSSSSDVQMPHVVQKLKDFDRRDVALLVFAQDTNRTNGNSIRNDTTSSGGGMLSYRQSARWWAGYEATYGYTKYSDVYSQVYRIKHTSHEATLAYLIKSPSYSGFSGFFTLGGGIVSLSPSQYGGSVALITKTPATQTVPAFTYTLGLDKAINSRFGVRIQYRDDVYKCPNFKQVPLNTTRLRSTNEPGFGVYYRF